MRLALPSVLIAVLMTVAVVGCGSGGSEPAQTTAHSQSATRSQTAAEEPGEGAPAGAAARSCGSAEAGVRDLRVTGVECDTGRAVAVVWSGNAGCESPAGASRFACSVRGYRCLGAATERGVAVSCARPGRSIAFVATRR